MKDFDAVDATVHGKRSDTARSTLLLPNNRIELGSLCRHFFCLVTGVVSLMLSLLLFLLRCLPVYLIRFKQRQIDLRKFDVNQCIE